MKLNTRKHIVTNILLISTILFDRYAYSENETASISPRPNIVIILADDMGYGDLHCQNPDSKIPTPNLDKLAQEGTRFTDAHSPSSVCTPTRYALLTGEYAWRTRLKSSVLWPWDVPLIDEQKLTLPAMLKAEGYSTACIGKWHLGWDWPTLDGSSFEEALSTTNDIPKLRNDWNANVDYSQPILGGPTSRGFDYYFGDDVPNFPPYSFIENERTIGIPTVTKPKGIFGSPGLMIEGWDLTEVMPAIAEKSVEYIHENSDTPFFLYVPFTAPHTPIAPAHEFIGTSQAHRYGDFVVEVDWAVGRIMKALEESGNVENTIVIFTSDNGSPHRDGSNMNGGVGSIRQYGHNPSHIYRGNKADIWEGGHRVPFIVKWPGHIPTNRASDQLISHVDLMATCAEIIGTKIPTSTAVDSYSLLSTFTSTIQPTPARNTLVHHSLHGMFSIRHGDWKFIEGAGGGGWKKNESNPEISAQLYDLANDPGENRNLHLDRPEIVKGMQLMLNTIRESRSSIEGYNNL